MQISVKTNKQTKALIDQQCDKKYSDSREHEVMIILIIIIFTFDTEKSTPVT
jgi:hypothetical protein